MENTYCVHLIIEGRVQGVSYRAFTQRAAKRLGINGWVRNLNNGHVEAVISGAQHSMDKMLGELHKGPLAARVDNITISEYNLPIEQGFNRLDSV